MSRLTGQVRTSAVRELLKVTARPDMISFAGGLPSASLFPIEAIQSAADAVLTQHGSKALQYGETEGVGALREWIAQRYSTPTTRFSVSNVLIVSGSQQALDLFGRVSLDAGDGVVTENPTYLAALSAWRPLGARFLPVASDSDGICVESLETLFRERPKFVYTIPNFQNPQGITLSASRRAELLRLAKKWDVVILEDNPYGELRFQGTPLEHVLRMDEDGGTGHDKRGNVVHLGTFSKVLAPGLRVGWVIGPEEWIESMSRLKQATDLQTATFNQYIVLRLVESGLLETHIPKLREAYGARRDRMLTAMDRWFPKSVRWTRPEGGMFLFVTLPEGWEASQLLKEALEQNVAFVPGQDFHVDGTGRNTFRLNFSNATPEQIDLGIQRLGSLLQGRNRDLGS